MHCRLKVSMLIPFYKIKDNVWIEAYLISKVDPLAKVGLIKSFKNGGRDSGELKPVPYANIKSIIANDIKWIDDAIGELENGTKLKFRDYVVIPMLNPGQYMAKVGLKLIDVVTLRVTRRIYDNLLKIMPKEPLDLRWFDLTVIDDKVYVENTYDDALTNTFINNDSLRNALRELLRNGG